MGSSKKLGNIAAIALAMAAAACSGTSPLVGSDGSAGAGGGGAGASSGGSGGIGGIGGTAPGGIGTAAALGAQCLNDDELLPYFAGYTRNEVNIGDQNTRCASQICLQNHFQGRVSCPYGQAAGSNDCLIPGSNVPVSSDVMPQLVARQGAVASICSCQCAGYGPGPYCTCPTDMECDHLVDQLSVAMPPGQPDFSGSYCIPSHTLYDPTQTALCTPPNCGAAHPY